MTNPITLEILREIKEDTDLVNGWDFENIVLDQHSPNYSAERVARVLWLLANDHVVCGSYVDHASRKYNESIWPEAQCAEDRSLTKATGGVWNLTTIPREQHEVNQSSGRQGFLSNLTASRLTITTKHPVTGEAQEVWHPEFIRFGTNAITAGVEEETVDTINELLASVEAEVTARPKAATERFGVVFVLSSSTVESEYLENGSQEIVSNWIIPVVRPELARYAPFKELQAAVASSPRLACGDFGIKNVFGLDDRELRTVWEALRVDVATRGIEALIRTGSGDIVPTAKKVSADNHNHSRESAGIESLVPRSRKERVVAETAFEFSGLAPKGSR